MALQKLNQWPSITMEFDFSLDVYDDDAYIDYDFTVTGPVRITYKPSEAAIAAINAAIQAGGGYGGAGTTEFEVARGYLSLSVGVVSCDELVVEVPLRDCATAFERAAAVLAAFQADPAAFAAANPDKCS